ncbi:hypothetical protein AVEN_229687-1 [Araneus ventricosus]|uniref:Endonuclease/exonuclease/phosphatase domain-containing protein n=1 Tax=Araneus ventricosus TaxID=182803 RepID=A0A4Y2IQ41_ARAVE|nr:hypothetical protein AVEN_229687-1 [Araneus ventricosus]
MARQVLYPCHPVFSIFLASGENTVIVKIPNEDKPLTLISSYFSPAANLEEMIKELEEALSKLQDENVIIGADMNAHCVRWDTELSTIEDTNWRIL